MKSEGERPVNTTAPWDWRHQSVVEKGGVDADARYDMVGVDVMGFMSCHQRRRSTVFLFISFHLLQRFIS